MGAINIADNVVVTFSGTSNFIGNSASNIVVVQLLRLGTHHCISLELVTLVITQQEIMVVQ